MSITWWFILAAIGGWALFFTIQWTRRELTRRSLLNRLRGAALTELAEALPAPAVAVVRYRKEGTRRKAAELLDLIAAGAMSVAVGFKDAKPKPVPGTPRPRFYRWLPYSWEHLIDSHAATAELVEARSRDLDAALTSAGSDAATGLGFTVDSWERLLPHAYALERLEPWERHYVELGGNPEPLRRRVSWVAAWAHAQLESARRRPGSRPGEPMEWTFIPPEPDDFPD